MNEYFKLRPGTPDDDNRDYLPPKLYHSDIVVNEGGNNSQPYPERLQEFNEQLVPGVPGNWFEYVPSSYDGSKKVPLVVSLHSLAPPGSAAADSAERTMSPLTPPAKSAKV